MTEAWKQASIRATKADAKDFFREALDNVHNMCVYARYGEPNNSRFQLECARQNIDRALKQVERLWGYNHGDWS